MFRIKTFATGLYDKFKAHDFLAAFFVFLFFLGVHSLIYLTVSGVSSNDDQWFYFKLAYLFRTEGWKIITDFKWLYFTDLAQHNLNYGITLYHYFLLPFTYFQDKVFGMKLSGVFLASSAPAIIYYVFRKFKLKYSFVWVIFFYIFSSPAVIWRLFIARAFILIDGLILLEIFFIYKRKYWPLFIVAAIHTWWHTGTFWLVPMMAVLYELVRYINFQRIYYRNILFGAAGAVLGFIFFPPHSDQFFAQMNPSSWIETLTAYFYGVNNNIGVSSGSEVYKKDFLAFFANNNFVFITFIFLVALNIALYIYKKRRENKDLDEDNERVCLREFLFLLVLILALGLVAVSGRFEDLLIPCLLLSLALAFQFIAEYRIIKIENALVKKTIAVTCGIFLTYMFVNKGLDLRTSFGNNESYRRYEAVGRWLKENTKEHEIIFNTNWSQAPRLFFYDDWNYYIVGMEPKSLYRYDQKLYWLWHNISYNGIVCADGDCGEKMNAMLENKNEEEASQVLISNSKEIALVIKDKFKSRYIFIDENIRLKKELDRNKEDYEQVYSDMEGNIYVYAIK